jgi:hypothetical protein
MTTVSLNGFADCEMIGHVDSFPDPRKMKKHELMEFRGALRREVAGLASQVDDASIAYRRRVTQGKLNIVTAEIASRLREETEHGTDDGDTEGS